MIKSTASPQARHKPRASKRSKTTEQQPDKEALLLIDSEPALSGDGDDWYYFWYKIPGQKKNANGSGKSINCRKYQISWVKEAFESNTLLQKDVHFEGKYIDTPNGPAAQRFRFVLKDDCCLPDEDDVFEDDDPPMTYDLPLAGKESLPEVPILRTDLSEEPPSHDPRVTGFITSLLADLHELGYEPTPEQMVEATLRSKLTFQIEDFKRGRK